MSFNYLAIFAAAIAGWIAGAAYYAILAKPWLAASGKTEADVSGSDGKRKMPAGPMILSFVAALIMAFLFAGLIGHLGFNTARQGAIAGLLMWIGFVITTQAVNNAFQMRNPMLTVIDGAHWLIVLVIHGAILAAMQ